MKINYKDTKSNSDATRNYDVIAEYPCSFVDFCSAVLETDDSFRIVFHAMNDRYGGWWNNKVEFNYKNLDNEEMQDLLNKYMKETIADCWANGGWGQMTYFMTFV